MTRPPSITARPLPGRAGVPVCSALPGGRRSGCGKVIWLPEQTPVFGGFITVLLALILNLLQSQQINTHTHTHTHTPLKWYCKAKFLSLGTTGILGQIALCVEGCPVHCRAFGSNAGLSNSALLPLLPSLVVTNSSVSGHCQVFPGGAKLP